MAIVHWYSVSYCSVTRCIVRWCDVSLELAVQLGNGARRERVRRYRVRRRCERLRFGVALRRAANQMPATASATATAT